MNEHTEQTGSEPIDRAEAAAEACKLYDVLMKAIDVAPNDTPLQELLLEALHRTAVILDVSGASKSGAKGLN